MTLFDKFALGYAVLLMAFAVVVVARLLLSMREPRSTDRDEFLRDPLRASVEFDPREPRR